MELLCIPRMYLQCIHSHLFLTFLNAQENVFIDIIITIIATAVAAVLLKKAKNLAKMELHGWQRKTKPNDGFHH